MRTVVPFLVLSLLTTPLAAQVSQKDCPCVPITHLWVVKTCADWICASTELAVGNGDPQVIAIPVAIDDARWLIVRRFVAGAAIDTTNDPFELEQFDGMKNAATRFAGFGPDHRPMLMTAPDGQVLVITLRLPETRRRASGH